MKNETNEQISSTNTPIPENFKPTTLTENINYGTINSADIENGTAELVLIPPFESDDGGISVACVGGEGDSCEGGSAAQESIITLSIDTLRYGVSQDSDEVSGNEFRKTFKYIFTTTYSGYYYIRTTRNVRTEGCIYTDKNFNQSEGSQIQQYSGIYDKTSIKANLSANTTYYLKIIAYARGTFGILVSSHDIDDVCVNLDSADQCDLDNEGRVIIYSMPNNSLTEGTVSSGTTLKLHTFSPREDEWYYVEGDFLKNGHIIHDWGWCKGKYLGNYVNYATAKEDSIRVRPSPSTQQNKIGVLSKDSLVEILEKNCETDDADETIYTKWHKIRYIGSDGYVFAGFFNDKLHWLPFFSRNISLNGKEMLKRLEGFRPRAYKALSTEPNFTIGYGHLITDGSKSVTINGNSYEELTEDLAIILLEQDLNNTFIPLLNNFLINNNIVLRQNQYDACVMDCFQKGQNIWENQIQSIAKFILDYQSFSDYSQVLTAFLGGTTNEGLKNRRTREANLFVYNIYS